MFGRNVSYATAAGDLALDDVVVPVIALEPSLSSDFVPEFTMSAVLPVFAHSLGSTLPDPLPNAISGSIAPHSVAQAPANAQWPLLNSSWLPDHTATASATIRCDSATAQDNVLARATAYIEQMRASLSRSDFDAFIASVRRFSSSRERDDNESSFLEEIFSASCPQPHILRCLRPVCFLPFSCQTASFPCAFS